MITPHRPQTSEDVRRHYDSLDFFYRDAWGHGVHHGYWESGDESVADAVNNLNRAVIERAAIGRGDHVCDIGCGYGDTSRLIARHCGAMVTGFTLSETQRREAEARASGDGVPRPEFLRRDWLENGLDNESVDAVVSIECVSHVADKKRFFSEIRRVLKPGGRMVLCAWLAGEDPRPWMVTRLLEPICHGGCLAGLASLAEYRSLIEGAGLVVRDAADIGPRVARTWRVILLRVARKLFTDPHYVRLLAATLSSDRNLAFTVPRLMLAYRLGCMGYGLIVARKPCPPRE